MKGYWIAKYKKAEDAKKLGNYAEKALKAITDFALTCYKSKNYQEAWSIAKNTVVRDLMIVEGI
ncbi:MAG: DUF1330 domain-containing protein [Candidatus Fonsibacter ubiquis]|nr:DUF1330 domain-containing protein [Candidatus Fonsibacter ubiquis]